MFSNNTSMKQTTRVALIPGAVVLFLVLSACASLKPGNGQSDSRRHQSRLEATEMQWLDLGGEWAAAIDGNDGDILWLTLGESHGARIQTSEGSTLAHWDRPLEYFDFEAPTADGQGLLGGRTVYASFDSAQSRPILYTLDDTKRRFELLMTGDAVDYAVEDLCLYRDSDKALYLFMLGEDHRAHQMLVTGNTGGYQLRPVRGLPIPPGGEYCAVDQGSGILYVSEEDKAVFGYSAHPETSLARDMVELASPWGHLGSGPRDLVSQAGELFILERETPSVHVVRNREGRFLYQGRKRLGELRGPETITLTHAGGQRHLTVFDENTERFAHYILGPIEDSHKPRQRLPDVRASVETEPVASPGDAADDPAVWVHPDEPEKSLILGTDKQAGLNVYNLKGELVQFIGNGRVNNVDVRYNAKLQNRSVDLAAASNRTTNTISLYAINRQTTRLELVSEIDTELDDIYGFCLYQSPGGDIYAFANDKDGTFDQFELSIRGSNWSATHVRRFRVPSQPEGCVADDKRERLFLGEEAVGIHAIGANPGDGTQTELIAKIDDRVLFADVEGISIYRDKERDYLIASAQNNNSYAVYEAAPPYNPLGSFRIGMNPDEGLDGASETDGLFATSAYLGPDFPQGMLVVQDGRKVMPQSHQNFKAVPWERIRSLLNLE